MPRSRRAPRSAAISSPRAAAAEPRSPRVLPCRAPRPVPRCRLGSRGRRRRCSGPARPARLLSREGRLGGASLLQGDGEGRRAETGGVSTFRGGGGGSRSPGSRRRHPPPTPAPHASARGRRTRAAGVASGGPGRAPPAHAQARASLARTPRAPRRPAPAPIPAAASRAAATGPVPSPSSPEPRTGAGRARRALLLASGKPRRSDPPPLRVPRLAAAARPRAAGPRERFPPSHLPGRLRPRDPRARGAPSPGLSRRPERARTSSAWARGLYIGPRRKPNGLREETWARRGSARAFMCSPKTIAIPPGSCWDLARLPWEGARRPPLTSRFQAGPPSPRASRGQCPGPSGPRDPRPHPRRSAPVQGNGTKVPGVRSCSPCGGPGRAP